MDKQKIDLIVKHLEMIQNVVTRMANNSFALKGWSITIISALLALNASDASDSFAYLAFIPALVFWVLDAYFLSQERYFRRLYDKVRQQLVNSEAEPVELFDMAAPRYAKPGDDVVSVAFSQTLLVFHGMIVVLVFVVWGITYLWS